MERQVVNFWRVQAQGIHLSRLIYLSKEEYEELKELKRSFIKRASSPKGEVSLKAKSLLKKHFCNFSNKRRTYLRDPRKSVSNETSPKGEQERLNPPKAEKKETDRGFSYEGTNIYHTRESRFWSWRRVREYYRELFIEENMDKKIKTVKELIYG